MTNTEHNLEVAKECEPLENFTEGQWWVTELDSLTGLTDDQKRAVAVVHNLLRSAKETARICAEKDAEIEREKQYSSMLFDQINYLKQQLSAANAAIAMKDEALKDTLSQLSDACRRLGGNHMQEEFHMLNFDVSTSPESIAAWEAEKLSDGKLYSAMSSVAVLKQSTDLQRQVAMLVSGIRNVQQIWDKEDFGFHKLNDELFKKLFHTQATAEAYELSVRIDEAEKSYRCDGKTNFNRIVDMTSRLDELHAANKKETTNEKG